MKYLLNVTIVSALSATFATGAYAITYDQDVFCNGLAQLASGDSQISVPVPDAEIRPLYIAAGLEDRLESAMYVAITTGQGDLSPFNEWLATECNGLQLTSE